MPRFEDELMMWRTADALDRLEGLEAQVTVMRYLGNYPYERIASELDLPVDQSRQLAISGLQKVKDSVFPPRE